MLLVFLVNGEDQDFLACVKNGTLLTEHVCQDTSYDLIKLPENKTSLRVVYQILSVGKVSPKDHSITTSVNLRLSWLEPRLQVSDSIPDVFASPDISNLERLWTPKLYIDGIIKFNSMYAT